MAEVRIGISGWRYAPWRGDFYPAGLRQADELAYAAERMPTVEINGTFYSLQRSSSFVTWHDATPDGFVFAVKGSRFITHMKRLADVHVGMANFFASGLLGLRDKLGPVLWQLPPTFAFDPDRLSSFFTQLPRSTVAASALAADHDDRVPADRAVTTAEVDRPLRHALEFRHASFATPAAASLCRDHDIALVTADLAGRLPLVYLPTADFTYVRLHGSQDLYASGYTDAELDQWSVRIAEWTESGHDVHVYFDNDAKGYAPFDALRLIDRAAPR